MMIVLFLGASLFDLVGLGLIGPYVSLIVDPGSLDGELGRVVELVGLPREQKPLLIWVGFILIGIFLFKVFSVIGTHWVITRFSRNQQMRLQAVLMDAYQKMPYTDYLRRNSSEYIQSILNWTGQYSGVVQILMRITCEFIVGLAILTVLAWTNGYALALLFTLLVVLVLGYDLFFRERLKRYGLKANKANMSLVQSIHEGIEGFKEIRVLGSQAHFLSKVRLKSQELCHYEIRSELISIAPRYILELAMVSFIVLFVMGLLIIGQDLKVLLPTLGVFGVGALRLVPSVNIISSSFVRIRVARDAVSRLHRDLMLQKRFYNEPEKNTQKTQTTTSDSNVCRESFQDIELQNLSFRYPNSILDALQYISLEIHAGESVGLIGPSGAGKTTLVDILLGLLEPKHGSIRYNRKPLHQNLPSWQAQVAYLPQQVFLIDNTLRRNVALGAEDEDIDEIRLSEALGKARLVDLVEQLPLGVETLLGERGARISGGQRQRIALARAFYHDRNVLVMDEATSELDHETECEIIEEIKHLKGKITTIVIAHRLTTVQHCDRIYRLKQGKIVKVGSPNEMLVKVERSFQEL